VTRHIALAIILVLTLALHNAPARADCTLTSNGQTRPPGTLIYENANNVVLYCAGTVWKALVWNAGLGAGGGSCFDTWIARDSNRDWTVIASSADGTKLVAVVENGQIYTSTDSGVNWTARESNRNWRGIASSSDGTKLAAAAQGGQIYTSTDSGVTWTARESNRNWAENGVASSDDGTKLVAAVYGGQIYTSTDSGVTWTARESDRNWGGIASSADGTKLVAGDDGGEIYTSTDSGVTWTPRGGLEDWNGFASSADGTKLAAVAWGGQIYTSTDSGVTWTPRVFPAHWESITSSSDGMKLAAAILDGGMIYTSTDGGAHWTSRESDRNWAGIASSADGTKLAATDAGGQIYTSECTGGGGAEPDCTDDDTATCTLDATRDSGDPEFTAANIADGVNILGVTGTLTGGGSAPSASDGYFVMTANGHDGNFGGLSGADAFCLSELTAGDWKNKATAQANGQLIAAKVRAFLCDGTTCQNGQPNTKYYFANAMDDTAGGNFFTADASGFGPGDDTVMWGFAAQFGGLSLSYWTGRAQTGTSLWPNSSHADRCNGWTSASGGVGGQLGQANTYNSEEGRWSSWAAVCDNGAIPVVCFVDP
jgi:photosystem II stability/assembly factor-like uncharacterized protein